MCTQMAEFMLINGLQAEIIPNDFNRMHISIEIVNRTYAVAKKKDTLYSFAQMLLLANGLYTNTLVMKHW